jgi:hypothetical protein
MGKCGWGWIELQLQETVRLSQLLDYHKGTRH